MQFVGLVEIETRTAVGVNQCRVDINIGVMRGRRAVGEDQGIITINLLPTLDEPRFPERVGRPW